MFVTICWGEVDVRLVYNLDGLSSVKQIAAKPGATIIDATAKTRSIIENLQARLARDTAAVDHEESIEDLEQQLQAYFARSAADPSRPLLEDLRGRVVEKLVDRILAEWSTSRVSQPDSNPLIQAVMDRLVERVWEEFEKGSLT